MLLWKAGCGSSARPDLWGVVVQMEGEKQNDKQRKSNRRWKPWNCTHTHNTFYQKDGNYLLDERVTLYVTWKDNFDNGMIDKIT